jgi:hypothetical protein
VISFPAPALCQGADEELLIQVGAVVFPGCIKRWPGENGLRIWVHGNPTDPRAAVDARERFQIVLGVIRAWRWGAGELVDERRAGLGERSVRDEAGNQWVMVGPAIAYGIAGGEIESLAAGASRGISTSMNLRNALWLNGRANRTAADFYMIYEYARREFDGPRGIRKALGLSEDSQERLTKSANNLSPLEGGRHVDGRVAAPMSLNEQGEYIAQLLRQWVRRYL